MCKKEFVTEIVVVRVSFILSFYYEIPVYAVVMTIALPRVYLHDVLFIGLFSSLI